MSEQNDITITYDALIDHHTEWAGAEKNAASDAGERRQKIGAFADKYGVENKALSQIRAGLKIKNDGKRMDWLRSMEAMLPMARNAIFGNQPEMPFEVPEQRDQVVPFDPDEEVAEFNAAVDEVAAE